MSRTRHLERDQRRTDRAIARQRRYADFRKAERVNRPWSDYINESERISEDLI